MVMLQEWKARNNIAYSYRLPVEELRLEANLPKANQPSGVDSAPCPISVSQPEILAPQDTVGNKQSEPSNVSSHIGSSSNVIINEIGSLLQKVNYLSCCIPSTADRLSKLVGLFPPGHGPSKESVKQATAYECAILESLKSAASLLESGFAQFGLKQDSLCREYEEEAAIIAKQISGVDAGSDKVGLSYTDHIVFDQVLGQSVAEAEEDAKRAEERASQDHEEDTDFGFQANMSDGEHLHDRDSSPSPPPRARSVDETDEEIEVVDEDGDDSDSSGGDFFYMYKEGTG